MKIEELRKIISAMDAAPWIADQTECLSGSITVRASICSCTGRRPSAGFCPSCHFVADWVTVTNAPGIVALRNHADALLALAEAVSVWRDIECCTQSAETDDYTLISDDECAGDTHADICPVYIAQSSVIKALSSLEDLS